LWFLGTVVHRHAAFRSIKKSLKAAMKIIPFRIFEIISVHLSNMQHESQYYVEVDVEVEQYIFRQRAAIHEDTSK
jgi:hypothetical protein